MALNIVRVSYFCSFWVIKAENSAEMPLNVKT